LEGIKLRIFGAHNCTHDEKEKNKMMDTKKREKQNE